MVPGRWTLVGAASVATLLPSRPALSQAVSSEAPLTVVVGTPALGSRTDRVTSSRTGYSKTILPTSNLHVDWETSVGVSIESAPVVDASSTAYVVAARGDVIALARDGTEKWRAAGDGLLPGPAALLSDDIVVFTEVGPTSDTAVGVRAGKTVWRKGLGPSREFEPPAPLPLDDGGVIVGAGSTVEVLDAEGHERSRMVLHEVVTGPIVCALGKIAVVTQAGSVWTWVPGSSDATRVGTFGAPLEGAAALARGRWLVGVNTAGQVKRIDLMSADLATLAVSQASVWRGPPSFMEPDGPALVMRESLLGSSVAAIDWSGREMTQALLEGRLAGSGDAGMPTPSSARPALVDSAGTVAFADMEGRIGVVSHLLDGAAEVELLSTPCSDRPGASSRAQPAVAGMAPLADGWLVVACRSGAVFALTAKGTAQPGRSNTTFRLGVGSGAPRP